MAAQVRRQSPTSRHPPNNSPSGKAQSAHLPRSSQSPGKQTHASSAGFSLGRLLTSRVQQLYAWRNAQGRRAGLAQYGGDQGSENAVERGLRWLARHQDQDGKWDAFYFIRHCHGSQQCYGQGYRRYNPAVTGLALMAFAGAGYTHRQGPYRRQLRRALAYLRRVQGPDGFFTHFMYNHGIVLLAVGELYAQTGDLTLAPVIRRAIPATLMAQQPHGGWTYRAFVHRERNDSSVTGWQVLALATCQRAGFHVPLAALKGAIRHFHRLTEADSVLLYEDRGPNTARGGTALVAVGLLCRLILGDRQDSTYIRNAVAWLSHTPPQWEKRQQLNNSMYYWYHGTLAAFLVGGQLWRSWNRFLKPMLIKHQVKDGEAAGSWEPSGKWGSGGGRVYATALNVLNLEIYYRYRPQFLVLRAPALARCWQGAASSPGPARPTIQNAQED